MNGVSLDSHDGNTVSFAQKLAESPRFKTLFRDGMMLVEEVAAYLDGPGREDARSLDRPLALAYAAESMRLTTRLMQLASWLLVQRAFNEGEMTPGQAAAEKNKVRLCSQEMASGPGTFDRLPARLREFTERSLRLQTRLLFLHRGAVAGEGDEIPASRAEEPRDRRSEALSELDLQWEKIRVAFNRR